MLPKEIAMSPLLKAVFWFVAANALAGAASLLLFPNQTETLFFWPIRPPISAGLFGALYLCGAVAVSHATLRGRWETSRYLIPVLVSAGILLTLTTFIHLDRFTPGFRLFYWLLIYIGAPLLAIFFYWQHEKAGATWEVLGEPVTPATRAVAIGLGIFLILFGIVSLIMPSLIIALWPWEITPLMVRVFASWFSAFAPGLLWFAWERDWNRLYPIANLIIATAGLDLLITFIYRQYLKPEPLNIWLFCAHLAAFGLVGLFMHWSQRKATRMVRQVT
jgi:hypothetical protein